MPSPLRGIRNQLRDKFFRTWQQAFRTDDGKAAAVEPLKGLLNGFPKFLAPAVDAAPPYADLGRAEGDGRTSLRDDILFITARFRSGSTLLWNLFRHAPGCTSYYEPLNERQWFNPSRRGQTVDATHLDVEEYWTEYENLGVLGGYFSEEWASRHLLMDENFHDPRLKRYIEIMVERAPGRPVLQFNRVDFRLPWLKHNFPNAKLVHIYRHPRDQWVSSLMGNPVDPLKARLADFTPHDRFYLTSWVRDLKYHFPFLSEMDSQHPYRAFYLLWKLSWMAGTAQCHCSMAFEHLVTNPEQELDRLLKAVDLKVDPAPLLPVIQKPPLGKWTRYANDEWFQKHETACETILADFFA